MASAQALVAVVGLLNFGAGDRRRGVRLAQLIVRNAPVVQPPATMSNCAALRAIDHRSGAANGCNPRPDESGAPAATDQPITSAENAADAHHVVIRRFARERDGSGSTASAVRCIAPVATNRPSPQIAPTPRTNPMRYPLVRRARCTIQRNPVAKPVAHAVRSTRVRSALGPAARPNSRRVAVIEDDALSLARATAYSRNTPRIANHRTATSVIAHPVAIVAMKSNHGSPAARLM